MCFMLLRDGPCIVQALKKTTDDLSLRASAKRGRWGCDRGVGKGSPVLNAGWIIYLTSSYQHGTCTASSTTVLETVMLDLFDRPLFIFLTLKREEVRQRCHNSVSEPFCGLAEDSAGRV